MSHSVSLREHILKTKREKGWSFLKTSKHFGIGIRSLFRWSKKLHPSSNAPRPGAQKVDLKKLQEDVNQYPDAYQRERAERFNVSAQAIANGLNRLNITYKKNVNSPKGRRRKAIII